MSRARRPSAPSQPALAHPDGAVVPVGLAPQLSSAGSYNPLVKSLGSRAHLYSRRTEID
jgi:hypothetical protein